MTQPLTVSKKPSRPFAWTAGAALVTSCGLAGYFLVGYVVASRFQPASPATVLRAAHFSGSWPLARLAWIVAVLLGLGLLGWSLVVRPWTSARRRASCAGLALLALACVVTALPVSPARIASARTFEPLVALQDAGGYARAGLLFLAAAVLYAGAALASRSNAGRS